MDPGYPEGSMVDEYRLVTVVISSVTQVTLQKRALITAIDTSGDDLEALCLPAHPGRRVPVRIVLYRSTFTV